MEISATLLTTLDNIFPPTSLAYLGSTRQRTWMLPKTETDVYKNTSKHFYEYYSYAPCSSADAHCFG